VRELLLLAVLGSMAVGQVPQAPAAVTGRAPTFEDFSPKPFPKAWDYVTSEHRFNAVFGGRRGGKTVSMRARTIRQLAKKAGSRILYITLIKKNCRKLYWHPLKRELKARGWNFKPNETDLSLVTDGGGYVEATSCENMTHVGRVRGDGWDLVLIDECQEPRNDVQEALVEQVLVPSLVDSHGGLDMGGTPPPTQAGFFVEWMKRKGVKVWTWTMFDNPNIDAATEVQELFVDRGTGPGHPIYEREIMGRLVTDPTALAYEYLEGRNDYDPLQVDFLTDGWRHAMGLDLGFSDHDAIVAVSWHKRDPHRRLFVRWRWQRNHLDVDDIAGVMDAARVVYRGTIVGDHGGHGAVKVLASIKKRLRCTMQAKPGDVMVSVGLCNDDLRTGRLLLPTRDTETPRVLAAHDRLVKSGRKRNGQPRDAEVDTRVRQLIELEQDASGVWKAGSCAPLGKELGMVTKERDPADPSKVRINKRGFHSDLSEAMRYAQHAARHWAPLAPEAEKDHDDERIDRWQEQQKRLEDPWK
jgi:hypothetical protein